MKREEGRKGKGKEEGYESEGMKRREEEGKGGRRKRK